MDNNKKRPTSGNAGVAGLPVCRVARRLRGHAATRSGQAATRPSGQAARRPGGRR